MPITLPSEADEWIQAWRDELNASEEYSEAGEGWGTDFDGSFLFEMEPDSTYDGEPIFLYADLEDGECVEARVIDDRNEVDWGFAYRGPYSSWKELVTGDLGAIEGLMDGQFELDGDMQKVLQYSEAATIMTENAARIDTEFIA